MFMTMMSLVLGWAVGLALLMASSAVWRARRRWLPWLRWPRQVPIALGVTPDQAQALADGLRGAN